MPKGPDRCLTPAAALFCGTLAVLAWGLPQAGAQTQTGSEPASPPAAAETPTAETPTAGTPAAADTEAAPTQESAQEVPAEPARPASQGDELQESVQPVTTSQAAFARERQPFSFYARLRAVPMGPAIQTGTCTDPAFGAWLRHALPEGAGSAALLADIRLPGAAQGQVLPLLEVTVAEDPASCVTRIVDQPLTPYALVAPNQGFDAGISLSWSGPAVPARDDGVIAAAEEYFSLSDGAAGLIALVESDRIASAGGRIDDVLERGWTASELEPVSARLGPYPRATGDWDGHADALAFQPGAAIADWREEGAAAGPVPALRLEPEYLASFFTTAGRTMTPLEVLTRPIGLDGSHALGPLLRGGLGGLSTAGAARIDTPSDMLRFCNGLKGLLSRFLTEQDGLLARQAVLALQMPNYLASAALRSEACLSRSEVRDLAQVSPDLALPDLKRERLSQRDAGVRARMLPITVALRNQDQAAFERLLADPASFTLHVLEEGAGPGSGGIGSAAIRQVMAASLRSGCYRAAPEQGLAAIPAIARLPGKGAAGMLAQFDDAGKLTGLVFAEPAFLARLTGIRGWPTTDCALR